MQGTTHTRLKPRFVGYVIAELHGQRIMHCPLFHFYSIIKQKQCNVNVNHTHIYSIIEFKTSQAFVRLIDMSLIIE